MSPNRYNAASATATAAASGAETTAWWRLPIVWLVIGGPALVVVASFITLTLALRHPDPVLATPAAKNKAEQPAVQGRNHAATPEL
jgi:hypothetical protein